MSQTKKDPHQKKVKAFKLGDAKVANQLVGLVEYLLSVDKTTLSEANVTSMNDNNGGRIYY